MCAVARFLCEASRAEPGKWVNWCWPLGLYGLIPLTTPRNRCQSGLFINEEAEAQRDEVTGPRTHSCATDWWNSFSLLPPSRGAQKPGGRIAGDSPPLPGFIQSKVPSTREQQTRHLPKGRGHTPENRPSGRHWAPARPACGHGRELGPRGHHQVGTGSPDWDGGA